MNKYQIEKKYQDKNCEVSKLISEHRKYQSTAKSIAKFKSITTSIVKYQSIIILQSIVKCLVKSQKYCIKY